jgi:hydrogenase-1 operon protein HyaF
MEELMGESLRAVAAVRGPAALVEAVLREVVESLAALARDPDFSSAIDLRSLPMPECDRERLRTLLGQGDVEARFEIGGTSSVRETAYAGVWWVTHCNGAGVPLVEQIEVASVPLILRAHPADVAHARDRLWRELQHAADRPEHVVLRER